jgi:hypothetical protein
MKACMSREERASFLKKRSKKLPLLSPEAMTAAGPTNKSFFASFFSKKEVLTYF